jgi:hypothetical protein
MKVQVVPTNSCTVPTATGFFAAAACLILACASQPRPTAAETAQATLSDLRGAVLVDIKDHARAQEVSALVDRLAEEDRNARDAVAAYRGRLLALNANYDATEDEFNKLFADFNNDRLTCQHRIAGLWTRMASLTTDAEWDALGKARIAAVKALVTPG